jgi:hypothetical protein
VSTTTKDATTKDVTHDTDDQDGQAVPVETTKRSDAKKVKVGDTWSRISFGTVVEVKAGAVKVRNNKGDEPWDVSNAIIENEFAFANPHHSEATKEVTGTEAIAILKDHPRTAMTVCFHKKPDPKKTAELLKVGQGNDTEKAWVSKVRKALEGEVREIVGYHVGTWTPQGHLQFFETGKGIRSVDPRTINWIILDRSKYVVK